MFIEKVKNHESSILVYGITPPKRITDVEQLSVISARQLKRLQGLDIDALILYDIQDELSRTTENRPFPFIETVDGFHYQKQYLSQLGIPSIIYRAVGKYTERELGQFLEQLDPQQQASVFVGASAAHQAVTLSMSDAFALRSKIKPDLCVGGVVIPERHIRKRDEHVRVFHKIAQGCQFFVSQGVYNIEASLQFLADYAAHGQEQGIALAPIIFTLTPCGSLKTLAFMKWLGISVPDYLEQELTQAHDILERSVNHSEQAWLALQSFAKEQGIPIGCNVESVAVRKVEVEASLELLNRVAASMLRG